MVKQKVSSEGNSELISPGHKTSLEDLIEILEAVPNASDIFLQTDTPPKVMANKKVIPLCQRRLTVSEMQNLLRHIADGDDSYYQQILSNPKGDHDKSFVYRSGDEERRFRVASVRDSSSSSTIITTVLRRIEADPWPLSKLTLPTGILEATRSDQPGLILINGPTGSGKTSLLSGLLADVISQEKHGHLFTIEQPVEYIYKNVASLGFMVTQVEVGKGVDTFAAAVKRAMRMRPTHILVGEIRDPETAAAAISAARSGHVVFATMHTSSVAEIFTRWTDFFPDNPKLAISELASSILYAIYQTIEVGKEGVRPEQEYLDFTQINNRDQFIKECSSQYDSIAYLINSYIPCFGEFHPKNRRLQTELSPSSAHVNHDSITDIFLRR